MAKIAQHIFNRKKLNSILNNITLETIADHAESSEIKQRIDNWCSLIEQKTLNGKNEISLQDSFLNDIFGKILDYKFIHESPDEWHIDREKKTVTDGTRSDGALGFFSSKNEDVRVVIELKDAKTGLDAKQKRKGANYTPVEQAFLYSGKFSKKCKWIIVSNYKEIRLYNRSASMNEYESFFIENLKDEDELKRFCYLFSRKNLIDKKKDSVIEKLYNSNEAEQEQISKEFYNKYKSLRLHVFEHLKQKNSGYDDLILLEKTQKMLDRFIFVCYCEDFGLLPERIFRKMMEAVDNPMMLAKVSQWDQLKSLFRAIDQGSPPHNINKFNGGLFEFDEILDGRLIIGDEIFNELGEITDYDFDSELNVNVLGHIFEQSITDIEEIKSAIAGESFDKKKGKRKKDGIFYTPEYITRYIVEQAVGGWLEDRKKELGFEELPELTEKDFDSIRYYKKTGAVKSSNQNIKDHLEFWRSYKEKLSNIKVLDPACGSGAFLNQAFDFLYKEGQHVNEQIAKLQKGQIEVFRLDEHILKNNLFGVDLNPESVEITKLGMWLKTADKRYELTALDDNIKCGNSLIDDPEIAGDRAFKWEDEFSEVMGNGGFDVVIGNPPWGAKLSNQVIDYLCSKYKEITGEVDTYIVFMFKSFHLISKEGFIGLIVPDTWLTIKRGFDLRGYIYNNSIIKDVYDRYKPFEAAKDTRSHTIILKNQSDSEYIFDVKVSDAKQNIIKEFNLNSSILRNINEWNLYISQDELRIFQKMEEHSEKLGELYNLKYGLRTGNNSEYLTNTDINRMNYKIARGSHIERYFFNWKEEYLKKTEGLPISHFDEECLKEKIIVQRIRTNSTDIKSRWLESAYIEEDNFLPLDSTSFIYEKYELSLKYLLAVISSYLMNYYYKAHYTDVNVKPIYLEKLPIPKVSVKDQEPFIEKADTMLTKNKELHELKTDFLNFLKSELKPQKITKKLENWHELDWDEFKNEMTKCKSRFKELDLKERKEWQSYFTEQKQKAAEIKSIIDTTDKEIDQMVYELYGLTQEEIDTVNSEQ